MPLVSPHGAPGKHLISLLLLAFVPLAAQAQSAADAFTVEGTLQKWHPLTITFEGPAARETGTPNPFRDYRLDVTFTHADGGRTYVVPGYFAADGHAAETSAAEGNKWRVHFLPRRTGTWQFEASFRRGNGIATAVGREVGTPASFDGATGTFSIQGTDKTGRDFRGRGLLQHVGGRYLQFDDGGYFLKGGADSPENFLAYTEFDDTHVRAEPGQERPGEAETASLHQYGPHVQDWEEGDPTWQDGRGKGIIGALNYLASEDMNSVYFLTMNATGDGNDVWPWIAPDRRFRFDVSKLAQWEIVFDHMTRNGLMLHVLTQETENDALLDGGELGPERKLYYRELVARFGHHPALQWNLGEENTNTDAQRKAFARHLRRLDPYDHPIVVHTYPGDKEKVYAPLLGFEYLDGPSLQMGNFHRTHAVTREWIRRSAEAGRPWYVSLDEIGPANTGVPPDGADDSLQAAIRHEALWGHLMAGGAGVEWYFGYQFEHDDLATEDWRTRDNMWNYTRHALRFFHEHLPFAEMTSQDDLTPAERDYVLAREGEVYAVYLPNGRTTSLQLADGTYEVAWYNPRTGGPLQEGTVTTLRGAGYAALGQPPQSAAKHDWVALVRRSN